MRCAVVVKHRNKVGYITDANEGAKRMSYDEWLNNANSMTVRSAKALVDELRSIGLNASVIMAK